MAGTLAVALVVNPVSGENLQTTVADIVATPKPIGDRLLKIIGSPNWLGRRVLAIVQTTSGASIP